MNAPEPPIVELRGVTFAYPRCDPRAVAPLPVLKEIDLTIRRGEFVCLLGASGCGKTTLLNLVAGFLTPTAGSVRLRDALARDRAPRCGMVFQTDALFPWLTVRENVAFGPVCRRDAAALAEVPRAIERVGLAGFERYRPAELSGGMRQRVALARALVARPDLLLDEPFGSLDAQTRETMQELLADLHAELGATLLMITHDIEEAVFLADRILLLSRAPGRIVAEEPAPLPRPRTVAQRETPAASGLRATLRRRLRA